MSKILRKKTTSSLLMKIIKSLLENFTNRAEKKLPDSKKQPAIREHSKLSNQIRRGKITMVH